MGSGWGSSIARKLCHMHAQQALGRQPPLRNICKHLDGSIGQTWLILLRRLPAHPAKKKTQDGWQARFLADSVLGVDWDSLERKALILRQWRCWPGGLSIFFDPPPRPDPHFLSRASLCLSQSQGGLSCHGIFFRSCLGHAPMRNPSTDRGMLPRASFQAHVSIEKMLDTQL